jgi:hypothetical protein
LENLRYYAVAEALALDLADITQEVLQNLLTYLALTPEQRAGRILTPIFRYTGWSME